PRQHVVERACHRLRRAGPAVRACPLEPALDHPCAAGLVVEDLRESCGETRRGARIEEPTGAAEDLWKRAAVTRHDRCAALHRLQHRETETLVEGRQNQRLRSRVQLRQVGIRYVPSERDKLLQAVYRAEMEQLTIAGVEGIASVV